MDLCLGNEKRRRRGWPHGPMGRVEVVEWPSDLLLRLVANCDVEEGPAQRVLRLRQFVHVTQWHLIGDYSGDECFREALRLGSLSLAAAFDVWDARPPLWLRRCDIDALPQSALRYYV